MVRRQQPPILLVGQDDLVGGRGKNGTQGSGMSEVVSGCAGGCMLSRSHAPHRLAATAPSP